MRTCLFYHLAVKSFESNSDTLHCSFSDGDWVLELDLFAELFVFCLKVFEVHVVLCELCHFTPGANEEFKRFLPRELPQFLLLLDFSKSQHAEFFKNFSGAIGLNDKLHPELRKKRLALLQVELLEWVYKAESFIFLFDINQSHMLRRIFKRVHFFTDRLKELDHTVSPRLSNHGNHHIWNSKWRRQLSLPRDFLGCFFIAFVGFVLFVFRFRILFILLVVNVMTFFRVILFVIKSIVK